MQAVFIWAPFPRLVGSIISFLGNVRYGPTLNDKAGLVLLKRWIVTRNGSESLHPKN